MTSPPISSLIFYFYFFFLTSLSSFFLAIEHLRLNVKVLPISKMGEKLLDGFKATIAKEFLFVINGLAAKTL